MVFSCCVLKISWGFAFSEVRAFYAASAASRLDPKGGKPQEVIPYFCKNVFPNQIIENENHSKGSLFFILFYFLLKIKIRCGCMHILRACLWVTASQTIVF